MSEDIEVCVLCKAGATPNKRLVNDPGMLRDLLGCCQERVYLAQSEYQKLTDHLLGFSDIDLSLFIIIVNVANLL